MNSEAVAWSLAVALVIALGVAIALQVRVRGLTRQLEEATAHRERRENLTRSRPVTQAASQAATIMSKVVETAARVREQGVGGMLVSSLDDFTRWAADQRNAIARVADEDGTVTIFFSDIEGSTSLNADLGDERWVKVLSAHDELVETYVEKYRGLIVKKQGDGHMVVFGSPELALRAATDIQRAFAAKWNHSRELRRTHVSVRIGLHTGTAIERRGDYFGQNVALAARVAGEAQGGQILVTEEIAEVELDRIRFVDAGIRVLKGFDEPCQLYRVETTG